MARLEPVAPLPPCPECRAPRGALCEPWCSSWQVGRRQPWRPTDLAILALMAVGVAAWWVGVALLLAGAWP